MAAVWQDDLGLLDAVQDKGVDDIRDEVDGRQEQVEGVGKETVLLRPVVVRMVGEAKHASRGTGGSEGPGWVDELH